MTGKRKREKIFHTLAYLKDYRYNSILIRYFILLFLFLAVPVTLINSVYGRKLQENAKNKILDINMLSLERECSTMNSTILSAKKLTYNLANHDNISYLVTLGSHLESDTSGNLTEIKNTISALQSSFDYLDSIYVYLEAPNAIITSEGNVTVSAFSDTDWMKYYSHNMPRRQVLQVRNKNQRYPYLMTMIYPIYQNNYTCVGAIVVNLDVERLGNYFGTGKYRNAADDSMMIVFDAEMDKLIYSDEYLLLHGGSEKVEAIKSLDLAHQNENISEICELGGIKYAVSTIYSQTDEMRYFYFSPIQQFGAASSESDLTQVRLILLSAVLCMLLAILLSVWIYKPIQRTIRLIDKTSSLTAWDKKEHLDEIKEIQRAILTAQKKNENLNEEIEERITDLHNAQICALQMQINPHFLYNTLEAIGNSAALQLKEDNIVTKMIFILGRLMRISLSSQCYLVPISEELEHIKLYTQIMDFRYHGTIQVHFDIPDSIMQERILKLTLQPLVENSIEHGLSEKRCHGDIWIQCSKADDQIFIRVVDNGVGMTAEQLDEMRKSLDSPDLPTSEHLGLRNIHQRLRLVYGDLYGLQLTAEPTGGLCVTIHIHTM